MNRPSSSGLHRRLRPLVVFASLIALATTTFSLPAFAGPAHAALATTVGATDPVTGVPLWFEDSNGLRLQLCTDPAGAPGTCAAASPTEQFYWRAVAKMPIVNNGRATLTLATEAAYPNGVVDGTQFVFDRLRVAVDGGLVPGAKYTATTPYGPVSLIADSRGRAKSTEDSCLFGPCGFPALNPDRVGPWLRWDSTAPAAPTGYIGSFAVTHAVTGSPLGTNVFRIVKGDGTKVGETDQFTVSGQIAVP